MLPCRVAVFKEHTVIYLCLKGHIVADSNTITAEHMYVYVVNGYSYIFTEQ